jgi:hypothetical protein
MSSPCLDLEVTSIVIGDKQHLIGNHGVTVLLGLIVLATVPGFLGVNFQPTFGDKTSDDEVNEGNIQQKPCEKQTAMEEIRPEADLLDFSIREQDIIRSLDFLDANIVLSDITETVVLVENEESINRR